MNTAPPKTKQSQSKQNKSKQNKSNQSQPELNKPNCNPKRTAKQHTLVKRLTNVFEQDDSRIVVECSNLFDLVHEQKDVVFLDSSLTGDLGKFSIIGLNPHTILEDTDGIVTLNGGVIEETFDAAFAGLLEKFREPNHTELPIICGAIGFLSYDYGCRYESIPTRHEKIINMPDARMVFYDNFVIENKHTHELFASACGVLKEQEASIEGIQNLVDEVAHNKANNKKAADEQHASNQLAIKTATNKQSLLSTNTFAHTLAPVQTYFTKNEYKEAIGKMVEYMAAGDIYVTNMTQQFVLDCKGCPYDIYKYLQTHNPAPFSAYLTGKTLSGGNWAVCSASMERFLQVRGEHIQTRPIKGTRPRGKTPQEDKTNEQELRNSEKDKSELLMIVDLERNDLSRICQTGSVEVTRHFEIEKYATVFHLVTTIEGKLAPDCSIGKLLAATFPGGSITGAPKIRAMQIIDELERTRRGLYTGSIGYISSDGSIDLNIVIRTAICQGEKCFIGAGGGITYESDLEFEYEETLQKAKAIREAVAYANDVARDGDGIACDDAIARNSVDTEIKHTNDIARNGGA